LNGRAYKQAELLNDGKYPVLRVGNFFSNRNWYFSDLELEPDKYCDNGDLLYAWSASFGPKIWDGGKVIYHYHIWKTRPNERAVAKMFLYYWLEWDKENIKAEHGTGSTMIHVAKGDMEGRPLCLPPFQEQHRIIAKIEGLHAPSARARNQLDHVRRLVEKYKQAILAEAFSSAGGVQWSLGELASPEAPIRYGVIQPGTIKDSGVPLVRVCDLHDGAIAWFDLRRISSQIDEQYADARVQIGDVLISVVGTIGRIALVDAPPEQTNIARAVARVRPDQRKVLPDWLAWRLRAPDCQKHFHFEAREVARKTLNIASIRGMKLNVPPLANQRFAVDGLTKAMGWIDRLANEATNARTLIDHLDQAVLAKAFQGELVPQDPRDEPASVLLERIRAERTNGSSKTQPAKSSKN
jgi:type I restriction enzyme S subunit